MDKQPKHSEFTNLCWHLRSIKKLRAILKQKLSCSQSEQAHHVYSTLVQRAEAQVLLQTQQLEDEATWIFSN